MLVANSFDLWQKDIFFSAAEEVQKSADIMESAYRTWLRERREGVAPQFLDELRGELQMALGTAKWQLDEFEKAVRLSYKNRADEVTMTRHRDFVSAMEAQISRVEAAVRESYNIEGKEHLPWVRLDENECDDLAQFLSGSSQTMKDEHPKVLCTTESLLEDHKTTNDFDLNAEAAKRNLLNQDAITCNMAAHFTREQEIIEISQSRNDKNYEADRLLSSENAVNNSALEIVIDNGYGQMATSMSTEITPKEKGFKPSFWRPRCEDHRQAKGGMLRDAPLMRLNWINQLLGQLTGYRQVQAPLTLRSNRSIRLMLILMLTIFLVGKLLFLLNFMTRQYLNLIRSNI
nr:syntaxin/T-SNARE family protein [Ipomoea batatas]GMD81987.1 syntaxin/T-SNARE family protein [Ipomoea batatas]